MNTIIEKIYIIQPIFNDNYKIIHEEAIALIESAGAEYKQTFYQNIREINPATFIGSGKVNEIREVLSELDEENVTVLFNGTLSPSQTLNISEGLGGIKVIDRTTLILDIFAKNAVSSEGKIQVELAQLKYIYPRLKGKGVGLSRLGAGIGSRGPGETKLETDRRHIRERIKYLESRLKETETRRGLQVERRNKDGVKIIALVGYTNTGKSTILNLLTGANVLSKDQLFATLDPTARQFEIESIPFLLVDTVGFLQELPHDIIESFKSTLENALNCDLALFVADASDNYEMQFETTISTLNSLGFNKEYLKVLNKCDLLNDNGVLPKDCVQISARNGQGIDELKNAILKSFSKSMTKCSLIVSYGQMNEFNSIQKLIYKTNVKYNNDGAMIDCWIDNTNVEKFNKYIKRG